MAETAVSFASQHVLPKFLEAVKMLKDLPKEVADVTDELENFQDFIRDAYKVAEVEKDHNRRERIRKRLIRLREAAFRMEDVIDDYVTCDEKQPEDPRCAALLCEAVEFIKTQIHRLQIAYQIQDVKSLVRAERDGFQNHFPTGSRSDGTRGNENFTWQKLRMDPLFIKKDEVVGFEEDIDTLKKWLTEGREERTVISIVGMAGLGKTTLSKQVFDQVHTDFECHALITVSRSYTVEGLLRDMTNKLCKERREDPPRDVATMDQMSLIEEVRNRLHNKRYVVLFDDVWNETFWDDIELALIDNKNGSRILITTRDQKVVDFCKKCLFFEVHKLQPLSNSKSLELLCKKAFGNGFHGCCPKDYEEVGLDIVRKCGCLPLAIVAIGSLLYRKCKSPSDWGLFSQHLSLELESNSELDCVKKILSLSYDDLPQNLRSCLLYFGLYPEDHEVKCGRLFQQWIAEGFVKHERGRNLEEVAEQHLMELISRSLVLVSSFTPEDKVKACHVHDSIHEMIRGKMKTTGFCHYINDFESSGIFRRLTMATSSYDLSGTSEGSQYVRSILIFTNEVLSEEFTKYLLAKYMRLKVLDFEFAALYDVPENLGCLIHLKYLSFRNTSIRSLPKSIGKLKNLESLDVRTNRVIEVPKEITKLRKLRCLFGYRISTIAVKDSLGKLTSLEKMHELRIDEDGVVIRELGKLNQLRDLRLSNFMGHHSDILCSSVNKMQLLERLDIILQYLSEPIPIDLHITSSLSKLRKLHLVAFLKEFPSWIPRLQNLVKLSLKLSMLNNIPLKSLGNMPNLLILSFDSGSYEGETFHFENGEFQKLKELRFKSLHKLRSIFIDSGALQSLEKLHMFDIPKLKAVPSGIQHLRKLQVLDVFYMPTEFQKRIDPETGEDHWIIKHVPDVLVDLNFKNQQMYDLGKNIFMEGWRYLHRVPVELVGMIHSRSNYGVDFSYSFTPDRLGVAPAALDWKSYPFNMKSAFLNLFILAF
ncbi:disease resistance protein RPM1-like isoform X2 [Vigna unguiculata]|uniref:disease resistance protein RPM1-like isoform X2 n=1 Tax=Vigna unguiculata TaxID=3917 RepID=UPI0010169ADE|nr:disease resistance protein RPM1-like isoform X2 [Vigna unguiculata]